MQKLLMRLPRRPQPFLVRFAVTTAIMAVCIGGQVAMARYTGLPGLFLLVVGIFVVSTLFDHVSGFYAALLGTVSTFLIIRHLFPAVPGAPVLVIFFGVGIALAVFSEALRRAMERAMAAERAKGALFRALADRMHNNLDIAVSLLDMQGRAHDNPKVRAALSNAADRVSILAEGQQRLRPEDAGLVEMRCFLGRICGHLGRSIEAARSIEVDQAIECTTVSAEKAMVLGLIANELISNSIKHAFPTGRPGRITVFFAKDDAAGELVLTVADDGIGCPDPTPEGFGTRLTQGLTAQHGGRIARGRAGPGCRVEVRLPALVPNG